MAAKMFLRLAVLLWAGLTVVNCKEVPVVTRMVPEVANEGDEVTLMTFFNVTLGKQTCKPNDLQLLGGMYSPDLLIADFTELYVDDYRLRVVLDTSDQHIWVYNLTVECATRLNSTHFLFFAATWDCPGVTTVEQCHGLPITVNFTATDALPVCAGKPKGGNAPLPRRAPRYSTVRDIIAGDGKTAAKPPKLCKFPRK